MVARLVAGVLPEVLVLALASCGSDGGKDNPDTNGPQDIVGDGPAGADVPDDQAVEPDNQVIPPDVPDQDPGLPPGKCDPDCAYGKGQYCDEADWTCKDIDCTYCLKNKDCGEGMYCLEHQFANSQWGTFCTSDCQQDGDCPAGYYCFGTPGFCRPRAQCQFDACGAGALGDACDYKGSNSECGACAGADLTCFGTAPDDGVPCVTDQDCVAQGFPPALHPDCTNGTCGTSYCAGKCDAEGLCAEGFEAIPVGTGDEEKCYCAPAVVGVAEVGDPCPLYNVNSAAAYCTEGLECIGSPAVAETEACVKGTDCPADLYVGTPVCFLGHCGSSLCLAPCGTETFCADSGAWLFGEGGCFCIPGVTAATAKAGDACPLFNVNAKAAACDADLACTGVGAFSSGDACKVAGDCKAEDYPGNVECVDGICGSSYCAALCDDQGDCPVGLDPVTTETDHCFCMVP